MNEKNDFCPIGGWGTRREVCQGAGIPGETQAPTGECCERGPQRSHGWARGCPAGVSSPRQDLILYTL